MSICQSIHLNDLNEMKRLIKNGRTSLNGALIIACRLGHLEIVKYLVEHGADVNKTNENNNNALIIACYHNQYKTVKFLLKHGAFVNQMNRWGNTAIGSAIGSAFNKNKTVKILIKNGSVIKNEQKYIVCDYVIKIMKRRLKL